MLGIGKRLTFHSEEIVPSCKGGVTLNVRPFYQVYSYDCGLSCPPRAGYAIFLFVVYV